jgi:hypothetical protein
MLASSGVSVGLFVGHIGRFPPLLTDDAGAVFASFDRLCRKIGNELLTIRQFKTWRQIMRTRMLGWGLTLGIIMGCTGDRAANRTTGGDNGKGVHIRAPGVSVDVDGKARPTNRVDVDVKVPDKR